MGLTIQQHSQRRLVSRSLYFVHAPNIYIQSLFSPGVRLNSHNRGVGIQSRI